MFRSFHPLYHSVRPFSSLTLLQSQFIAQCLTEIKAELRQENALVKANAVSKLTYVSN